MNLPDAKHNLTGPIGSFRTPFDAWGRINEAGARRIIDAIIEGGSRALMLTAGDSHYFCLSDEEILGLTRLAVQHVADRAMVIVADRAHSTDRAVAFAEECRRIGADMFMALPPDWAASCTPSSLAEHYASLGKVLPVMIVTNLFIPRGGAFGMETIARALDASDQVIAIKDDMGGAFAQDLCMRFAGRCAIIAGGQKRNHMAMHPFGCDGYLSTMVTYNASIARRYWDAVCRGDLPNAARVITEQDAPLFRYLVGLEGGFDAGMHGMLEICNLAGRYRRKPYHTIDDAALEQLRAFLDEKGLLAKE